MTETYEKDENHLIVNKLVAQKVEYTKEELISLKEMAELDKVENDKSIAEYNKLITECEKLGL